MDYPPTPPPHFCLRTCTAVVLWSDFVQCLHDCYYYLHVSGVYYVIIIPDAMISNIVIIDVYVGERTETSTRYYNNILTSYTVLMNISHFDYYNKPIANNCKECPRFNSRPKIGII
jgi:hypothetical protein